MILTIRTGEEFLLHVLDLVFTIKYQTVRAVDDCGRIVINFVIKYQTVRAVADCGRTVINFVIKCQTGRAVADCGRTVINFGAWFKYKAVRTVTDWKNCYKLWCLAQVQSS